MQAKSTDSETGGSSVYHLDSSDPMGELVDRSQLTSEDIQEINRIMTAMAALREAEERLSEASLRYMKLNRTDMRALHFLIVAENNTQIVTPSAIAEHLKISTASTTKLLDRLEKGGHIVRRTHPTDRRALSITVQPETRSAAMRTVGRQHAKRFIASIGLSSQERAVVADFLENMASQLEVREGEWTASEPQPATPARTGGPGSSPR